MDTQRGMCKVLDAGRLLKKALPKQRRLQFTPRVYRDGHKRGSHRLKKPLPPLPTPPRPLSFQPCLPFTLAMNLNMAFIRQTALGDTVADPKSEVGFEITQSVCSYP